MNETNVKIWTTALRSDKYRDSQTTLCLARPGPDGLPETFCCLGVAAEESGLEGVLGSSAVKGPVFKYNGAEVVLPRVTAAWLGVTSTDPWIPFPPHLATRDGMTMLACSAANDGLHLTFDQIADLVDYFGIE